MDQQRALVAAEFPRFTLSVIERIQSTMAGLKTSSSLDAVTPATGNQPASNFDAALLEEVAVQRKFMCALLSLRVNLAPPSTSRSGTSSGRRDGQENGGNGSQGMRGSSVGSDYYSGGQSGRSDYYSQDSKLQRKAKRRKVYDGSEEIRFDDRRMRPDNGSNNGSNYGSGSNNARGFVGRKQLLPGPGYQGPEHMRRGPKRVVRGPGPGPVGRNTGGDVSTQHAHVPSNQNQNQKNPSVGNSEASTSKIESKNEEAVAAPIDLLQKLASMIQKVKK